MARAQGVCPRPGCPNLRPCPNPDHQPASNKWQGSNRRAELPKGWAKTVARIKKRDGYTCVACGGRRCGNQRLEVDHIGDKHDHRDQNLRTLGHDCHTLHTQAQAQAARTTGTSTGEQAQYPNRKRVQRVNTTERAHTPGGHPPTH